jgi:precorrin-2 dehydrogenase/sirohydrochlorin ferrochelatase
MDAFPAFFPLTGRTVALAGDGEAADAKARLFGGSPAILRRLSPAEALTADAYAGAALAFVALTGEAAEHAAAAARAAGVPVNVVDRPELCDFTTPAIVDRGTVVGAVGTGGAAPVLATLLRTELEQLWPEDLGARAALARTLQAEVRARLPAVRARRRYLRDLLRGPPPSEAEARRRLATYAEPEGRLDAVAAGGPAGRLRLEAIRLLADADVLVTEPGCDPAVLAFARRDALRLEALDAAEAAARVAAGDRIVRALAQPTD